MCYLGCRPPRRRATIGLSRKSGLRQPSMEETEGLVVIDVEAET